MLCYNVFHRANRTVCAIYKFSFEVEYLKEYKKIWEYICIIVKSSISKLSACHNNLDTSLIVSMMKLSHGQHYFAY